MSGMEKDLMRWEMITFIKRWWKGLEKKEQAHYDSLIEMIKDQGRARFNLPTEETDVTVNTYVGIVEPGETLVDDRYVIANNSTTPVHVRKTK